MQEYNCPYCHNVSLVDAIASHYNKCPVCFLDEDVVAVELIEGDTDVALSVMKTQRITFNPRLLLNETMEQPPLLKYKIIKTSNWGFIDN